MEAEWVVCVLWIVVALVVLGTCAWALAGGPT